MRIVLFSALALAACGDPYLREVERRVAVLESENAELRARVEELTPVPPPWRFEQVDVAAVRSMRCLESDDGTYVVPSSDYLYFDSFAHETLVATHVERGVPSGVAIFMRPDSLLASCGFASGDVLASVNGYSLATIGRGADAFVALQRARMLTFDIIRSGTRVVVKIEKRS